MVDMRTREGRALREQESREAEVRDPVAAGTISKIPDPPHRDGIRYRWVRTSTWATPDPSNVSMRFREGWVAVKKGDIPEWANLVTDFNSKFPDNYEVGGLLLCQIDEKIADARQKAGEEKARNQVRAADQNFMRQSDPRMPLLTPQRSSRTTVGNFGGGQPPR